MHSTSKAALIAAVLAALAAPSRAARFNEDVCNRRLASLSKKITDSKIDEIGADVKICSQISAKGPLLYDYKTLYGNLSADERENFIQKGLGECKASLYTSGIKGILEKRRTWKLIYDEDQKEVETQALTPNSKMLVKAYLLKAHDLSPSFHDYDSSCADATDKFDKKADFIFQIYDQYYGEKNSLTNAGEALSAFTPLIKDVMENCVYASQTSKFYDDLAHEVRSELTDMRRGGKGRYIYPSNEAEVANTVEFAVKGLGKVLRGNENVGATLDKVALLGVDLCLKRQEQTAASSDK